MSDVALKEGFAEAAGPLVLALQERLGARLNVFSYFDSPLDKGIGVLPKIVTERRVDPARHTLQLRLSWPEPAWMEFAHAGASEQQQRAADFAGMFVERLPALEAWYEFQMESSSQQMGEPIDMKFEVIGIGSLPGVDGDIV